MYLMRHAGRHVMSGGACSLDHLWTGAFCTCEFSMSASASSPPPRCESLTWRDLSALLALCRPQVFRSARPAGQVPIAARAASVNQDEAAGTITLAGLHARDTALRPGVTMRGGDANHRCHIPQRQAHRHGGDGAYRPCSRSDFSYQRTWRNGSN